MPETAPHPPAPPTPDWPGHAFEALFNSALDAVLIADDERRYVDANPAACALLGLEREAILGRRVEDFAPAEAREAVPRQWGEFLRRGSMEGEWSLTLPDGSHKSVEFKARAHFVPGCHLSILRDVTARRRAEAELLASQAELAAEAAALEKLNRVSQLLTAELDLPQVVRAVTAAAVDITGAQLGTLVWSAGSGQDDGTGEVAGEGQADGEWLLRQATPDTVSRTLRDGLVVRCDDLRHEPGGGPTTDRPTDAELPTVASYLAVPLVSRSGEVVAALLLGHGEPAVFGLREERLAVELAGHAAAAVDNARLYAAARRERERAEEASRAKDEFLAIVSHELRTPLTPILGWVNLLRTDLEQVLDPGSAALQAVDVIERNARAQAQLINDLLNVSRIITGKLRLDVEPIEMAPLIESALDTVRPAAEARNVALQLTLDTHTGLVSGDADRLRQVVWNLVSNAIKFTPKGGRVRVRLERVDSQVLLTVNDNGQGIEADVLPHIFERFLQADSTSKRSHGGLGLGLSIVRHLVEMHGGTVTAQSEGRGQGATFQVRLPALPVHPPRPALPLPGHAASPIVEALGRQAPANLLAGLHILVVEDEADARLMIRAVLEQYGGSVTEAASVREAMQSIDRERPDVLISDIGIPQEDGYGLIRRLRRRSAARGGQIPALALTAYARAEDRFRALAAGFQNHLAKPVEPVELVVTIASLVGRVTSPPE